MYSKFQLAKKYLHYFITAENGKGHGIHSPFVFDFIKNVMNDTKEYTCYEMIELQRRKLLRDETIIEVEDFGAGSAAMRSNKRVVNNIAQSSLKPKKFSQLLFRMVQYYQPKTIIELGTSLGITTSYIAKAKDDANVYTCEGAKNIAAIAQQTFTNLNIKNISLTTGDFNDSLPLILSQLKTVDLAFIDGNHRKAPTLDYFEQLLSYSGPSTILIFDDIHWSAEMDEAWNEIKQHPSVTLTIDLFFIGIVILSNNFKTKQHFIVRF
jgi:predicted O-methyltransferase YrrM